MYLKSLSPLKSLVPYIRPYSWLIGISFLLAFPLSALQVSPAPMLQYMLNVVFKTGESSKVVQFVFMVLGVYAANFVVRFFHYYLLRVVVGRVNQAIKNDLYDHIMRLSSDYFSNQRVGVLVSRVANDPQLIDGGIECINILIREPLKFVLLFGYAFYLNWKLTIVALAIFPALSWLFSWNGRHLKRYIGRMSDENGMIVSSLQESFTGIKIIKVFSLYKFVRKEFRKRVRTYTQFYLKTAALQEFSHPMVEFLTAMAIAAVIYVAGTQIVEGKMQAGDLVTFFTTFAMMMDPIRRLNDVNIRLNQASGACERIFSIMGWKSNLFKPEVPLKVTEFKSDIEFKNVSFSYPDEPGRKVLNQVSFKLRKGKTIAIVGASGSGKSSLASLIPRVFDVTDGSILVDGIDIKNFIIKDLRNLVAVVSQDVFLFNDSISENIRCGRFAARKEEIQEAARRANALEFIEQKPEGFQSIIGDRGQKLSGGERQRISIARAFLKDAPILILDEATSNLDNQSEKAVQAALNELMKDKTTLIIAHRLSTIQNADEILVMKEGQIVERGTHSALLEQSGIYSKFFQLGTV